MVITFLLLPKNQAEPVKHLGQFWISTYPLSGSVFGQRQHYSSAAQNYGGGHVIYTGPRGGQYYINDNGNKVYVPKR